MRFFVLALQAEAKPLITYYKLKRLDNSPFPLFKHENNVLIVTGMGFENALMATTYLLTRFAHTDEDLLINYGICAANTRYNIGDLLLAHTLKAWNHHRAIYPDLRFSHPFKEVTLTTFDQPQEAHPDQVEAADMEAYFVAKAALNFLTTGQIMVIKVVSDHFEPVVPAKEQLSQWLQSPLDTIEALIALYESNAPKHIQYTQTLQTALENLEESLQLTQTQSHLLTSHLNYYILRHNKEPLLPQYVANRHKKEQKDAFNKLLALLAS